MNDTDQKEAHDGIAFDINFEDIRPKSGRPPPRFMEYQQRSQVNKIKSSEEIIQKQRQADERRKAYEKAKIERIKERTEECMKINEKVHRLGVQTNYHGRASTQEESLRPKPLSKKEAIMSVKSLAKDFSKITMAKLIPCIIGGIPAQISSERESQIGYSKSKESNSITKYETAKAKFRESQKLQKIANKF